jgi:hypothetical protein
MDAPYMLGSVVDRGDAPYMLGSVVDRGRDNPAESFITHTSCIGQVELGCGRIILLCPGSLLGNVPYA